MKSGLPKLSILIPTLNAGRVLEVCLKSIWNQNYPKNKIEIIIADGGSIDDTMAIANKFGAKIIKNPKKTGESGKAEALKYAQGDLVVLIDSDNILPRKDWLRRMTYPFWDEEIVCSEPIKYSYRRKDPFLTRYFALLGMNDPICLFLGNYDRYSCLTGRWTDLKFSEENKRKYLKIKLDHLPIPTIGANGTIFRRNFLSVYSGKRYLFDIDILTRAISVGKIVHIAKVKVGIVHTFVEDNPFKFFRKQLRRINDLSFHVSKGSRAVNWEKSFFWKIIWFQIQCLLIVPIFFQTIKGFLRQPDLAWLFHPIACYSTWLVYLYGYIGGKIRPRENSRRNWSQ